LCARYAGEVIRIGPRLRLCRGCTFTALGGLLGGAVALISAIAIPAAITAPHSLIPAALAFALIIPSLASRRRLPKLLTRLAPSALLGFAFLSTLLTSHFILTAALATLALAFRILYGRRGGDRSPCATCPERDLSPCSGFAPIVRREQAFQRTLRRLIVIN
jgi:hypothetical protein